MRQPLFFWLVVVCVLCVPTLAAGTAVPSGDTDTRLVRLNDEYEPNDSFETAPRVEVPLDVEGLTTSDDDDDFYAVSVDQGDRLNVSVEFDHVDGDVDVVVFGPDRQAVASSRTATDDEFVSYRATEAGTYYVGVGSLTNETTTYSLSITPEPGSLPPDDDLEPNDGFETATEVQPPFEAKELRVVASDEDYYAVEVDDGMRLTVSVTFAHDDADLDLALYAPNGSNVALAASATDNESLSVRVPEGGRYHVEVSSRDGRSAEYSLTVRTSTASTATSTASTTIGSTATESSTPRGIGDGTDSDASGFTLGVAILAVLVGLAGRRLYGGNGDGDSGSG